MITIRFFHFWPLGGAHGFSSLAHGIPSCPIVPWKLRNIWVYSKILWPFQIWNMWFHVFVYLINDRSVGESHLTIKLLGTVLISISELAMATAKCSDFREPAFNAGTSVSHQSMWTPGFSGGPADSADQLVFSQHGTTGWIKEKKWWKIHIVVFLKT
jgi:hypothetical protein